jgi:hypothetical protein
LAFDFDAGSVESVRCVRRGASTDVGFTGDRFQTASPPGSVQPVVVDRVTGLSWPRCISGYSGPECSQGYTTKLPPEQWWSYCDTLQWAGATNWRSPTYKELYTLTQFSPVTVGAEPKMDWTTFIVPGPYLGAADGPEPDATRQLFNVEGGHKTIPGAGGTYPVLCVRWTEP